jgi:cytochrome c-type biogenesis protein CcmE
VKRKSQRLWLLALGLSALGGATAMVMVAFSDNLVFFYSPTQLETRSIAAGRRIRIGGLVEDNSLRKSADGMAVTFRVTDGKTDIPVGYRGALPDLFREGQGVVAEGWLEPYGRFHATTILAKHDARYLPPEVVAALKKSGHWKEGAAAAAARPPAMP